MVVIHADLFARVKSAIPGDVDVLVVPTPPEIAAAYGLAPQACAVPAGNVDWDAWRDSFAPSHAVAEAPGAIIYTSGTTGHPKGVKRAPPAPHQTTAFQTMLMLAFGVAVADATEAVTVVTGPMYHSAPNAYGLIMARLGATLILQPRFDPEELLRLIEERRTTHLHMVPIMFNRLLKLPEAVRRRYDLSSLKFVVHAAAPCPPAEKRAMIDWWGPIINEYYGATETGAIVFCTSQEWLGHPGTVGKALPGCLVKIVDEDGAVKSQGEIGEVVGRNLQLADFTYHGDDEKRRRAEKAGLITPGDIGYLDADGFLYLCDRSKDMIISGGVNIYPAEIEAELHALKGVADCAVFGIPDAEYGEAVCAVIQPQPEADLSEETVRAHLRARVAGYKIPRRIEFAHDLPREDLGQDLQTKSCASRSGKAWSGGSERRFPLLHGRWAAMSCVAAPTTSSGFVNHYLSLGAEEIFLFFDDPQHSEGVPPARRGRVRPFLCSPEHWRSRGGRPVKLNDRQLANLRLARAETAAGWLVNVDLDERVSSEAPIGGLLGRQAPTVLSIALPPLEAVYESAPAIEEAFATRWFKRPLSEREAAEPAVAALLAEMHGDLLAVTRQGLFGHVRGKYFVRAEGEAELRLHQVACADPTRRLGMRISGLELLHFDALAFADFVEKWALRASGAVVCNMSEPRRALLARMEAAAADATGETSRSLYRTMWRHRSRCSSPRRRRWESLLSAGRSALRAGGGRSGGETRASGAAAGGRGSGRGRDAGQGRTPSDGTRRNAIAGPPPARPRAARRRRCARPSPLQSPASAHDGSGS